MANAITAISVIPDRARPCFFLAFSCNHGRNFYNLMGTVTGIYIYSYDAGQISSTLLVGKF